MASVVCTLRIMPDGPDADLSEIEKEARTHITAFTGKTECKVEYVPIAFGLKAIQILFVMDEAKGTTEPLEKTIAVVPHVNSVEVTDVRRTIG